MVLTKTTKSPQDELRTYLNKCNPEDLIWMLFVMNRGIENSSDVDIKKINSIKNITELRGIILNNFQNSDENQIKNYIEDLEEFKESLEIRGRDFSKYEQDQRKLYFALYFIYKKHNEDSYEELYIKNIYFKFIYIIFTYRYFYSDNSIFDDIEREFDTIILKYPDHFKNHDQDTFYIFAKNYIDHNLKHNRSFKIRRYLHINDSSNYRVTVNSIFDFLSLEDESTYNYFKRKLSNAWYQKSYREKNKGKEHYYFLTKQATKNLELLTKKLNLTDEKVIEYLINEYHKEHCLDEDGKPIY